MKEYKLLDNVEPNNMIVEPFKTKYLDSEKEETGSETLTIRLNPQERATINKLKLAFHYSQDAKVIKIALILCHNVTQNTFGFDLMNKLCDENRRRSIIDDVKEIQKT